MNNVPVFKQDIVLYTFNDTAEDPIQNSFLTNCSDPFYLPGMWMFGSVPI